MPLDEPPAAAAAERAAPGRQQRRGQEPQRDAQRQFPQRRRGQAERTEQLARALATGFTRSELNQLMAVVPLLERLAESI